MAHVKSFIREEFSDSFYREEGNWWENLSDPASAVVLLGKLWNSTDQVSSDLREYAADWISENIGDGDFDYDMLSRLRQGCSYAQLVRCIKPILIEVLSKDKVIS
jgi:hypothetical protein